MLHDAKVLADAGADLLVLECIPSSPGQRITEISSVPVIGIGAVPHTDGQILVLQDILNISTMVTVGHTPRFVKNYMAGPADIESALPHHILQDTARHQTTYANGKTVHISSHSG